MNRKYRVNLIIMTFAVFIAAYVNQLVAAFCGLDGTVLEKISILAHNQGYILSRLFQPSFTQPALAAGCIAGGLFFGLIKIKLSADPKSTAFGSARWATSTEIRPFLDPIFKNNIILTASEGLSMADQMKNWKLNRNKNVLVIGSSGSGKTRYYVKPNLMQMHSSFMVTDPKGTLIAETGDMLIDGGYDLRSFNLIDFNASLHYNPFHYLKSEKDILILVDILLANTQAPGEKADFWYKAEKMYLTALIAYLFESCLPSDQNFSVLLDMIKASKVKEEVEDYKSATDILFEDLEVKDPQSFAVRQYKGFKTAAGKSAKSILLSVNVRLTPFDIKALRALTSCDEMQLDELGDRKMALFIITSDTNPTFNFLAAIMYAQTFNLLCDKALLAYGGALPVHVRMLLDEFANIGKIPDFEKLIAVFRSRNISASILLQAKSQLKALYKDHAETIIGNCDSFLFLGGTEKSTIKELSEDLGKETIDYFTHNKSYSATKSLSENQSKTGKCLASMDELRLLEGDECILQIRGIRPFKSKKYNLKNHPNYAMLSENHAHDYSVKAHMIDLCRYPFDHMPDTVKIQDVADQLRQMSNVLEDMAHYNDAEYQQTKQCLLEALVALVYEAFEPRGLRTLCAVAKSEYGAFKHFFEVLSSRLDASASSRSRALSAYKMLIKLPRQLEAWEIIREQLRPDSIEILVKQFPMNWAVE